MVQYRARKQAVPYVAGRLLTRAVLYHPRVVYSLFGMGMQRVDAERLERLESSPLCVV